MVWLFLCLTAAHHGLCQTSPQALHKLGEPTALLRVRQCDLSLAKEIMDPARKQYAASYGSEAPTLTLDQRDFLPPPPAKTNSDDDEGVTWSVAVTETVCCGGCYHMQSASPYVPSLCQCISVC